MKKNDCPICKKERGAKAQNAQFPFCSSRCKSIDLSRWLDQGYIISSPSLYPQGMGGVDY